MTILQTTAGGNLTFLRDKILYHKDKLLREEQAPDVYRIMDHIAEQLPAGSNGVICTPWIYGERFPIEDRHVRVHLQSFPGKQPGGHYSRIPGGRCPEYAVDAWTGREVLGTQPNMPHYCRWRRQIEHLVPDLCRRAQYHHPSGGESYRGQRARSSICRRRSTRIHEIRGCCAVHGDFQGVHTSAGTPCPLRQDLQGIRPVLSPDQGPLPRDESVEPAAEMNKGAGVSPPLCYILVRQAPSTLPRTVSKRRSASSMISSVSAILVYMRLPARVMMPWLM